MTRYDSVQSIDNPVDRDMVQEAVARMLVYFTEVELRINNHMNVTVENGNIFFYSRKTAHDRYFVEVKPATKTIKIILASNPYRKEGVKETPCQEAQESGLKGSATQP